jgi:type IV secretion system protein VirB9
MGAEAMKKTKLAIAMALLPFAAIAQTPPMVPAIDHNGPLVTAMSAPSAAIKFTENEQKALDIAQEWKRNPTKPRRAGDGGVIYLFGAALPTLICAELQVCSIFLQSGEHVNGAPQTGDEKRWFIVGSMIGSGNTARTAVVVKPWESGLVTNLIVNTNLRSYYIKLVSTKRESMSYIAFDYPDDQERAWANYHAKKNRVENASTMQTGMNIANLDFGYQLTGDNPKWKPQRVYNDGVKTYIQFPSDKFADEAPALVVIGKGKSLWSGPTEKLVNYRLIGDAYVVDQVIEDAALISGVGGNQTKVTIARGKDK